MVVIDDNYTGCTYFGGDIPPFQITTEKNLANVGCRVKIEKTVGVVSQTAERPLGPDSYVKARGLFDQLRISVNPLKR